VVSDEQIPFSGWAEDHTHTTIYLCTDHTFLEVLVVNQI